MIGINQSFVPDVCRVKMFFADEIGNEGNAVGTAFWLKDGDVSYFVNNKQNVDPMIVYGENTKLD